MYASARDMAVFLTANLGALPDNTALQETMRRAQRGAVPTGEGAYQALAWEVRKGDETIPERKIGVIILSNRGSMPVADIGRRIILALARR